jgi:NAD(P)-dependent dehydrogenase (short-subunit alcohol dehydrogenase family)
MRPWRRRDRQFRVNAIAPGRAETPRVWAMCDGAIRADSLRILGRNRGSHVFLLDDRKASFVTGHILNVDDGFSRGWISARPEIAVKNTRNCL